MGEVQERFASCSGVIPVPVSATASSTHSRPSATLRTRNATSFREPTGIAQEIEQNLLEPH